jgi:nitrogen fixation NifU-like protein
MSALRELYQEMIIDHSRRPRNFGALPEANYRKEGFNPLCGDRVTIHLLEQNNIITKLHFEGCGCAISMASASLMTETLLGKNRGEIETIFQLFHQLVTQGDAPDELLGKLTVLAGVAEFPARVKCATLAWHTLKAALAGDPQPVCTE